MSSRVVAAVAAFAACALLSACAADVPTYQAREKVGGSASSSGRSGGAARSPGGGSDGARDGGGSGAPSSSTGGGGSGWRADGSYQLPGHAPGTPGSTSSPRAPRSGGARTTPPRARPLPPPPAQQPPAPAPDVTHQPQRGWPRTLERSCTGPAGGPWTVAFTVYPNATTKQRFTGVRLTGDIPWIGEFAGYDLNASFDDICR